MPEYKRSWSDEMVDDNSGRKVWNLSIDAKAIKDARIEETEEGIYEVYYPRIDSRCFPSLEEAQDFVLHLPPVTHEGLDIARCMNEVADDDEMISTEEAGGILGVTRFRVNAMVANGVLPGMRKDGQTLVSRKAVEARKSGGPQSGPVGMFADRYIRYLPNDVETEFTIVQVHHDVPEDMAAADAFVKGMSSDEVQGSAAYISYSDARQLCKYARQALADGFEHSSSTEPMEFSAFSPRIAECLARKKESRKAPEGDAVTDFHGDKVVEA